MKKLLYMALFCLPLTIFSQEADTTKKSKSVSLNADFVSRYVWRGLLFSPSPNIQPYATFTCNNFSIGAWGSYGLAENYAEVDLFMSYQLKKFTFTVSDYYAPADETDPSSYKYFEFGSKKTQHAVEGSVLYSVNDHWSATLSTFFYGNDRDSVGDNFYSTYLELAYAFSLNENNFSVFMGGTTGEGYYAEEAAVVNAGISFSRNLELTDKFSIPLTGSLIFNPKADHVFFVFKITL